MRFGIRKARPLAFLLALIGFLAAIAVISTRAGEETQPTPAPEPVVDLIAYADPSGRIHVVDPEGLQDTTVSEDSGFFTWPAWSPDASSLAFSGIALDSAGVPVLQMRGYDLGTGTTTRIYENTPGMGAILARMPHYPLWSPDSSILSIMASEIQGLTLLLAEPELGTPNEAVLRNAPLYAGWSSDSNRLLVHAGAEHFVVTVDQGKSVEPIGLASTAYRAPSWRAGSNQVAFVSPGAQGQQELTVLDVVSGESLAMQPVAATVAFSWSPDGRWLAVGAPSSANSLSYDGVRLFSWDGSRSIDPITVPVIAFFWSPNSQYIAYVTLPDAEGVFGWRVHDVESRTNWPVAEFVPSTEQETMFFFFDQFAQSHSVWSPQSDALVFSGSLEADGISASYRSQTPPQVLVAHALARSTVRIIGTGVIAVWSPR